MIMITNYQNYIHKQNNSYSLSSKLCNKMGYVINPSKNIIIKSFVFLINKVQLHPGF